MKKKAEASILIVDDDENTRKSLTLIFKRKGYEIETAGTGNEAIKKAQKRFFNVVLLDIKLPDMKGIELLAPLKEIHPDMVMIMVTAHASLETAISALNQGASFYITKPLNMDEVLSTIREVMEKQHLVIENRQLLQEVQHELAERKRAEDRKKELETQLLNAQKMEAIGTMAGGIAHDFNNLLMGIMGNVSLILLNADSNHPHYSELKNIEQCVQRGAELTKQLLGFAMGGKYETKPTNLNEIIKKSSEMFSRARKEISIHEKYDTALRPVEVDRGQLEQVLVNLYVNAWHAMPGGGNIYIQTENVTLNEKEVKPYNLKPGNYVKTSITDTGIGMDEKTRQRIFEPFFTTKKMGRGTGLGLASVYGIIKNHGGFIQVHSEKGKGTTFYIYLPASQKEIVKEKKLPERILEGRETVLLVDDENIFLDVGEKLLNKMGYTVLTAKSGKEAIEIYEKNKDGIDIVILDMIMPGMGGGETFDLLKKINPDIKVLLSTGYSLEGQAAGILERGCSGFIQKPFRVKDLSQKIRLILDS
ncbi:MAG: response regulator [Candidatus Aminicenantes bacterium]|nr:response regulator [Candidatus Aminicenantes bacterium]NIM79475.1 response regulator [Candidatus Aminicenantes bacterium]NIN18761.1 response regulator [Candidatus Aminicenantes bacterium]NIN42683.1 response regulator [Candidatus Aminicenantes bacterium]NIN85417.1 response regulator [Candidatus Aminicenantes bacterium]